MNLLQVRPIFDDFLSAPQGDPEDISTLTDHVRQCVASTPDEFVAPERLAEELGRAAAIMDQWDWAAVPRLPQLANNDSWWTHSAWIGVKEAFAVARDLLPPVGDAEQQELDRQAAKDA